MTGARRPWTSLCARHSDSWRSSRCGRTSSRAQDAEDVLAAGVREDALIDAIHIAALFTMIVRLADSFGWHVPPDREFAARAEASLGSSYALLTPSDVG